MKLSKHFNFLLGFIFLFSVPAYSQLSSFEDIETTTGKGFFKTYFKGLFRDFTDFGDPFSLSGGVGLDLRSYNAFEEENRQDPFMYGLNVNLNVRIYKLNLPFSLLVTAKNKEYSVPNWREFRDAFKDKIESQKRRFDRVGSSPYYKWIKLHLGHRSMDFSQFTMSNLNFLGVGTELTPGNLRLSGMYGRLVKAEPVDLSLLEPNIPVYERRGWGAKVGYEADQQGISLIMFGAKDDVKSANIPEGTPIWVIPEENLSLGLNMHKLFFNKFRFRMDLGVSSMSENALDEAVPSSIPSWIFTRRNTTETNTALISNLDDKGEKYVVGEVYKRIEPNYRTLGGYFFNSDISEVTGNVQFRFFKDLINVNLSAGAQSNNLDLQQQTTTTRLVYNGALNFSKNGFNADVTYSNNTTDVGYILNQTLDSLNAVLISEDRAVNLSYSLSDKANNQHSITLSGNIQSVRDNVEDIYMSQNTKMYLANFVYGYVLGDSQWRFTLRSDYNRNAIAQTTTDRISLGGGISKSFLDGRMNFGLDINHYWNKNEYDERGTNSNTQFRWSYDIANGLSANMNWGYLTNKQEGSPLFRELTGTLGVQYNFSYQPKKKE